jgi:hypothetical protein
LVRCGFFGMTTPQCGIMRDGLRPAKERSLERIFTPRKTEDRGSSA